MARVPVKSSNLLSWEFFPEARILEVEFKGGNVYRYFEVPLSVFQEVEAASSIGSAFHKKIRSQFRFEAVPPGSPPKEIVENRSFEE